MTIEQRLTEYLHEKAAVLDVTGRPMPSAIPRRQRSTSSVVLMASAAALILVGIPLLLLTLISGEPATPATSIAPTAPTLERTTTTAETTTYTMVPPLDTPAMERFYAIAGLDARTDPDGILFSYTTGPDPIDLPDDVEVQPARAPQPEDMEALTAEIVSWILDSRSSATDDDKLTPILVTAVNEISGAFVVAWVAPGEPPDDDHVFCTSLIAGDALTGTCGPPGLIVGEPEPPNTPSRYTLPVLGLTAFVEETGYDLPINVGSANIPLETAYAILVGPNGERWLQQPISGSVLFAVAPVEPEGAYELYAYDAAGAELAVGLFTVSRQQVEIPEIGPDTRIGPYTCEPPTRPPMRDVVYDAYDVAGIVRPRGGGDGLDGPHADNMVTVAQLAEHTQYECAWELTGSPGLEETAMLSIVWSGDDYLGVIRTTYRPRVLPEPSDEIAVVNLGVVSGSWMSDTVFAGVVDEEDFVILFTSGEFGFPAD